MKLFAACLICLLAGVAIGWYVGSTRPAAVVQRKLTGTEEAAQGFLAAEEREERLAALLALALIVNLERGDTNKAYRRLTDTISLYYQSHRLDGDTNLLVRIERVAATNAVVAAAISRKAE